MPQQKQRVIARRVRLRLVHLRANIKGFQVNLEQAAERFGEELPEALLRLLSEIINLHDDPGAASDTGDYSYIARSPLREDKRPSLNIKWEKDSGVILLHDFAASHETTQIVEDCGLSLRDLFAGSGVRVEHSTPVVQVRELEIGRYSTLLRGATDQTLQPWGDHWQLPEESIAFFAPGYDDQTQELLVFETDHLGLVSGVVRRPHPNSENPTGKRTARGSKRGLVGVDRLDRNEIDTIYVTEGFSDAVALHALGVENVIALPAANTKVDELEKVLLQNKPRAVVVFSDGSTQEREAAKRVASRLAAIAQTSIVFPPDEIKDVREWVVSGGLTRHELTQAIARARPTKADRPSPRSEFPTRCLPAQVQAYVRQGAAALDVEEAFIAVPVLASLAAAIGSAAEVQVKPGWREPCVLWVLSIAASGSGKTPAQALAIRPLSEIDQGLRKQSEKAAERFEIEQAVFQSALRSWATAAKKGDAGPPPQQPKKPPRRALIVRDITAEALVTALKDNPRGLLVACDELGQWLNSMNAYKSKGGGDTEMYLSLHSAEASSVDRKSAESAYASRPICSIVGGIQPRVMRRAFGAANVENGLLARFLIWRQIGGQLSCEMM